MRKLYYTLLMAVLAISAGCQKDESVRIENGKSFHTIYASIEDEEITRTSLDENNDVLWSANDQISAFMGTDANTRFILYDGAGTKFGTFEDNSTSQVSEPTAISANVAYYPYNENITVSENNGLFTVSATFPATQTFSASGTFGSNTSPMIAVTESTSDNEFKFKNVGSIFRVQLIGTATITKIEFSAEANLAGVCNITASNTTVPAVEVIDGSTTIVLNCGTGVQLDAEEPTDFIVAMLPVENVIGGIKISIYDNVGKKMVYTHKGEETIKFERSKAYTTATLTYNGNESATPDQQSVQFVLDNAMPGTVIQLEPGVDYGTLVFRRNSSSKIVDITEAGGDAPGNERYSKYENITILGAPGATVDQIDFEVGWIAGSGANYVDIKNLIVRDVTFTGNKTAFNFEGAKGGALGIDGLTIDNCSMTDANGDNRLVFQQISGYKLLSDKSTSEYVMTTGIKDLTINNCKVTGAYMVIESRAMENLTITNNTFKGIKARDMLITSDVTYYPNEKYTGTITITGNTSTAGEERFIRGSLNNSDAQVIVKNNSIYNYKGEDYDWIKVSDATNVEFDNNIFYATTNQNLQAFILAAQDGTVFQLADENYGLLDFTHTYDGSKITAKNITLKGVEGTTMKNFISPEGGNQLINWKITDITFDGTDCVQPGVDIRSGGENLIVEGCKFLNNAKIFVDHNFNNITINSCEFDKVAQAGGVYCQNINNITIESCTFTNMGYNAIQLSGPGAGGNITINNNSISNCVSRAIRIVTKEGAVLSITNNTMTNSNNASDATIADRGQVIKITGSVTEGRFTNNTHNGDEVTVDEGIGKVIHD